MTAYVPVIAIDGPAASGKGTVASRVAARLGYHLLDSGALYRLVALEALLSGVATSDAGRLAEIAADLDARFDGDRVELGGADVTLAIRDEPVSEAASRVAVHPEVRAALFERQRAYARAPGLVADGRDMGTVIFPDAAYKVFLTASPDERAERRYKQLKDKGVSVIFDDLLREILARDARDANRAVAPLRPADDAVCIDTTGLGIDTVVERVLALLPHAR